LKAGENRPDVSQRKVYFQLFYVGLKSSRNKPLAKAAKARRIRAGAEGVAPSNMMNGKGLAILNGGGGV